MEDQGILPHPAADYMTTEMDFIGYLIYHIYSAIGKHLVSGVINSVNKTIDLSGLRANIYFLKLDDKSIEGYKGEIKLLVFLFIENNPAQAVNFHNY